MVAVVALSTQRGAVTGEAVYVNVTQESDLEKFKGKLAGKIVLFGAMRATPDMTEPLFTRYTDAELKEMETYEGGGGRFSADSPERARALADRARLTGVAQGGAGEDDGG